MTEVKIRLDCPHCGVRERRPVQYIRYLKPNGPGALVVTPQVQIASRLLAATFCDDCKLPFCIVLTSGANNSIQGILQSAGNEIGTEAAMEGAKIRTIPSAGTFEANDGLPEAIRQPFADIQEDAMKRRNAPGVMATARACLDVALKALGETQGGRVQRIQNLQNKGILTSSLSEWANKLWADGNDAVHDLEAKMDDAIEHVEFLKLFFEVVFVLPNKIDQASNPAATA
jgi:hypothetical protein